jgi:hypothetical protein
VRVYNWVAMVMIMVLIAVTAVVPATAAPYYSCRDGRIVQNASDCLIPRQPISVLPGAPGHGDGGGLLGTIHRLLGGLTGGLL